MMSHGQYGHAEVRSDRTHAFNNTDIASVEGAASGIGALLGTRQLHLRLTELIQSAFTGTLLDRKLPCRGSPCSRKSIQRFVFVTARPAGDYSPHTPAMPDLLKSLNENPSHEPLLQAALNAVKPFRVRDLRKYTSQNNLDIDNANLRSVLAIPIRLHRLSIGTILAFGKQEGVFFSESDESLADLLGAQAAASVESSWLYQELRNKESITSMLRQLARMRS
jgi:GAF domain-containing protein